MDVLWINVKYIARLIKRLNLQTVKRITEGIPFLRLVVPITSVDDLLKAWTLGATDEIGSAAGWLTLMTVEEGKRYHIRAYHANTSTGNTMRITKVRLFDGTNNINLLSFAAAGEILSELLVQDITMPEAWQFQVYVSTHNAGDKMTLYYLYQEEEAF